jgi:hypothetical protein
VENIGKIYNYLGITFDVSFHDEVKINMMQYIPKVIAAFPEVE